jgi:hypothetical protein
MTRWVALLQGGYYTVTGLWPLLSMYTFELVSGPKLEDWLVHTVGVLVTVIGLVFIAAALTNQLGAPVVLLAIGSASGLAFIDFYYALRGEIWPIYMLDGVGEIGLILLWGIAIVRARGTMRAPRRQPLMSGSRS